MAGVTDQYARARLSRLTDSHLAMAERYARTREALRWATVPVEQARSVPGMRRAEPTSRDAKARQLRQAGGSGALCRGWWQGEGSKSGIGRPETVLTVSCMRKVQIQGCGSALEARLNLRFFQGGELPVFLPYFKDPSSRLRGRE